MRIMLDLDGVFFNFGDSFKRYLDHIGQSSLWKSSEDLTPTWHWYKSWGWSDEQFISFCNDAADAGFLFTGPMREGGKEAWDAIVATGNEIIIVTDRSFGSTPESSERNTYEWLEQHDLYYDELWFSADKTVASCDMAIEDKIANYDALEATGCIPYLIDRAWNLQPDNRRRVKSIMEFAYIVDIANAYGCVV